MHIEVPYKNLKHTLQCLKLQVRDSLPYIHEYIPKSIKTPEELFYFLKDITTYKNDPKKVELLQTVQTLMSRDGLGDCDCFTILVLTSCLYLGFEPQKVVLVGNKSYCPSHIYTLVYDKERKKMCSMDLTNPDYDTQRKYKYKQILDFMMTLRLEDNCIPLAGKTARKAKKAVKKAGQLKRVTARVDKKTAKKVGKSNRIVSRQASHTDRVDQRGARKGAKRATKVQKKDNKLIRAQGRGEIIQARTDARIANVQNQNQQASYSPDYEPESDASYIPDESMIPGSSYQSSDYAQPEYSEYELMPDEEEEQLSGGIFDLVKGAVKGVVAQVKGEAKTAVKNVKAGKPVNQSAAQIKALQLANADLQNRLSSAKTNIIIFSALGTVGGATLGYLIKK